MKKMSNALRTRLNLLIATALAFAFGLGLASALDLTPLSIAADDLRGPEWVIGGPALSSVSLNGGFGEVVEHVSPAVATIYAEGEREVQQTGRLPFRLPPQFQPEQDPDAEPAPEPEPPTQLQAWSGSGFVVSEDGYVVTNNHVVEGADRIDIELSNQRRFNDVQLVGRDPQTDVALLKIDADDLAVLPIGSSDDTKVGEWVLAIGSPGFGGGRRSTLQTSVTAGIVSAKGRSIDILRNSTNTLAIEDFIQTDAVINRGNSGGPLINANGEVIGINTAIFSSTGSYQGYGFAIPIELAREVVDDLIEFGEVRRALIGVAITDVTSTEAQFYRLDAVAGAVVGGFSFDESPARLAGIEVGDVIVGVEGTEVSGVSDLQRRIRTYEPGQTVGLDIVRRVSKERDVARVKLIPAEGDGVLLASARRPTRTESELGGLGVEVEDIAELSRGDRREYGVTEEMSGVVVTNGDRRGAFGRFFGQVPEGIVITDINGTEVKDLADYERVASRLEPGEAVSVIYQRPVLGGGWTSGIATVLVPER